MHCGVCVRRHRFVERWDGAWYGTTDYGSCGDRWQDGELGSRPFRPGWRKEAQDRFRAMWENAAPTNLYNRYINADIRLATCGDDDSEKACADLDAAQEAIRERWSA